MKSSLIVAILFFVIFAMIIANAVFTDKYSSKMLALISSLPQDTLEGANDSLNDLKTYLNSKKFLITITCNRSKVREVYKLFSQAEAAILADDISQYTQARLALYDAVNALCEFNRFSFADIL